MPDVLPNVQENWRVSRSCFLQTRRELTSMPGRAARIGVAGVEKYCGIADSVTHEVVGGKAGKPTHLLGILDIGDFHHDAHSAVRVAARANEIQPGNSGHNDPP